MAAVAPALLITTAIASVVGTGLAVAGQQQQAESASDAAEANAEIAEQQADVARGQAAQERRRAAIEAENFARTARRQQGTRVSAIGASGIALSGSALDVLADAAMEDEQQRLFILADGEQRAQARLTGANIEMMTAAEFERQAAAERQAGGLRAAGTLIGGVAQTGLLLSQSPTVRRAASNIRMPRRTSALPRTSPAGGYLNPSTGMFGRV